MMMVMMCACRWIETLITTIRTIWWTWMNICGYFKFIVRIPVARHMAVVMIECSKITIFTRIWLGNGVQWIRCGCRCDRCGHRCLMRTILCISIGWRLHRWTAIEICCLHVIRCIIIILNRCYFLFRNYISMDERKCLIVLIHSQQMENGLFCCWVFFSVRNLNKYWK